MNKMKGTELLKGFIIIHQKDAKIWSQVSSVSYSYSSYDIICKAKLSRVGQFLIKTLVLC